jgi:hypothetical protein
MHTGIGRSGLNEANGQEIVARLRSDGFQVDYAEHVFVEPDGTLYTQRSIRCRNADSAEVERVMVEVLGRYSG